MSDHFTARPITSGPAFHFFGYYDKFQIDKSGTKMLTMEVDFMDRMPTPDDTARIGVIDLTSNNALELVAETQAWCWQQSCMLQWYPGDPENKIIYNVRIDRNHFGCCIQDIHTGEKQIYDTPLYTITSDGSLALCPNFSRLATLRPGYGYEGVPDPWAAEQASGEDGIRRLDFRTGKSDLIISLAQIRAYKLPPEEQNAYHWFNHLLISPDDRRFIFLHRWSKPGQKGWKTRMFTANTDGSDLHLLNDHEMTSHFIWRDSTTVLAWARRFDTGDHYYFFDDVNPGVTMLNPEKLVVDGHMSYPPGGTWFVTDTYPRGPERKRQLFLFNEKTEEVVDLGGYYADAKYDGFFRTDLHPRWSRDGRLITFDSIHEGPRQTYMIDVSDVVS